MKSEIILIDEVLGKLKYKEDYWELENNVLINFNHSKQIIPIKAHIMYKEFTEYKLGIGDWEEEDFEVQEVEGYTKYQDDLKAIYIYYMSNLIETTRFIEHIIIRDYNAVINEANYGNIQNMLGEEQFKVLLESKNNPLDLIKLKDITLFDDRIRILGECKWYINNEFGINLYKDKEYNIGNLDVIY